MEIKTIHFGNITYTEEELVHFPEGLFGFEQQKDFLPISFDEENDSILCLQSITDEDISFIIMNPFYLWESYSPVLSREEVEFLGSPEEQNLSYYVICVVREPMGNSTVNLKCPIVVNTSNRTARQIILENEAYSFRHTLNSIEKKGD